MLTSVFVKVFRLVADIIPTDLTNAVTNHGVVIGIPVIVFEGVAYRPDDNI